MQFQKMAVFSKSAELVKKIRSIVPEGLMGVDHIVAAEGNLPRHLVIALVDGKWPGNLHELLEKLAAHGVYTVLIDDEAHIGQQIPEELSSGVVDDLLLTPLRPLELLSKIKHAMHLSRINEVVAVNADLKSLIEKFEEDLRVTRAIQKSLIPEKFQPVHGLQVSHKYLSGFKSGGDYLDFFEFEDKTHVGILMSDSSGYGLSSAFMSVILRLAVKLSKEEAKSPSQTVFKIFEELQLTMKPNENLSIFYGVLNRKTFELNYTGCGSIKFVHQSPNGKSLKFEDLTLKVDPLAKGGKFELKDVSTLLAPEDRLVLFSDGFGETFESQASLETELSKAFGEDPIELINSLSFRIKKTLETEDDMPTQDCSVMVIDVEKRAMRLAK